MNRSFSTFFTLLILLTGTTQLRADTLTTSAVTFTLTGNGGGPASLSLPQFDPAQGTLTNVQINYQYNTDGNASMVFHNGSATTTESAFVSGLVGITDSAPNIASSTNLTPGPFSSITLAPGADSAPINVPTFASSTSFNTSTSNLTGYTGAGTFTVSVSTLAGPFISPFPPPGADITGSLQNPGTTSGSVSATYTFSTAPEPNSLVLLGIGGAATMFFGWRRHRKSLQANPAGELR